MKFPLKMVPPFGDMLIFGEKFSIKKFLVVLSLKVRSPGLISRQNSYMSTLKKGDQDSKGNLHLNQQTFDEGNIYVSFSWEYSQCFRKKRLHERKTKNTLWEPPSTYVITSLRRDTQFFLQKPSFICTNAEVTERVSENLKIHLLQKSSQDLGYEVNTHG